MSILFQWALVCSGKLCLTDLIEVEQEQKEYIQQLRLTNSLPNWLINMVNNTASTPNNDLELEIDESSEDESSVKYDIATYPSDFTLSGIVEMWKAGDITIPEFQREYVWSIKQASLLIESFLLGLPVPPVFFYIDDENRNLVIDGQQRILSTVFFFDGYFGSENLRGKKQVFRLTGLDQKSNFSKKTFEDLSQSDQRKLKTTVLRSINIRQLSPRGENTSIYHIFERLNTGGTPLKPQEIRNVVFRGGIVRLLRKLNNDQYWREIIGKKSLDKHQKDVELVLRMFALSKKNMEYEQPMKEFLNKVMLRHRKCDTLEMEWFEDTFSEATKLIVATLGPKPFHLRGPLNSAVLDCIFTTILNNIGNTPPDLKSRFQDLINDPMFEEYTTSATTNTITVRERLKLAKNYLIN